MNKNRKVAAIVLGTLVGLYALYFLIYVIYNIKYASGFVSALTNIFPAFMIFGILSFILLASGFGGWGKILRKLGRGSQAKEYEEAVKENEKAYEKVKTKYEKRKNELSPEEKKRERRLNRAAARNTKLIEYEVEREIRERPSKNAILIGVVILLICSAVGSLTLWLHGKESRNVQNGNYIETVAVVKPVRIKDTDEYTLRYVYEDENGNQYIYSDTGMFSGVNFSEGKTVKMYYNKYNPEIATSGKGNVGLLVVSVIFFGVGALVFFLNVFKNSQGLIPILVGGIFTFFGIGINVMISRAGGLNFLETIMSGPFAFGSVLFASLGAMFAIYGIFNIIRRIFYFSLYLIKKSKEKRGEL